MDAEAVQILREIRDEVRRTNDKVDRTNDKVDLTNRELQQANARLGQTNARLEVVESTLLDVAEQQRFVVRHLRGLAERDHRLEDEVGELRARVDRIEDRLGPE